MKSIALLADKPNWCFAFMANEVAKRCQDEFNFVVIHEGNQQEYRGQEFDLIYCFGCPDFLGRYGLKGNYVFTISNGNWRADVHKTRYGKHRFEPDCLGVVTLNEYATHIMSCK